MAKAHQVERVSIAGAWMRLRVDGKDYDIDLAKQSIRLAKATSEQRGCFEVSPSGYGIHWSAIDEDLSIDGLIGVRHSCSVAKAAR